MALITAESLGTGDAGSIDIAAVDIVMPDNAAITTRAVLADGGNININAGYQVYLRINSRIPAIACVMCVWSVWH